MFLAMNLKENPERLSWIVFRRPVSPYVRQKKFIVTSKNGDNIEKTTMKAVRCNIRTLQVIESGTVVVTLKSQNDSCESIASVAVFLRAINYVDFIVTFNPSDFSWVWNMVFLANKSSNKDCDIVIEKAYKDVKKCALNDLSLHQLVDQDITNQRLTLELFLGGSKPTK